MKTTESYPLLLEALHDVRGRWRRSKILEGSLLALAGVAVVLAVLVAADNLWQPGTTGRAVLAALLWGGLIAALFGLVARRCWRTGATTSSPPSWSRNIRNCATSSSTPCNSAAATSAAFRRG